MARRLGAVVVVALVVVSCTIAASGEAPRDNVAPGPVTGLVITDVPNDNGGSVEVRFNASPDDGVGANDVVLYEVQRKTGTGAYVLVKTVRASKSALYRFTDSGLKDGLVYTYQVWAYDGSNYSTPVTATGKSIDNTAPRPPPWLKAAPSPGDYGSVALSLRASPDDVASHREVQKYEIFRKLADATAWPTTATLTIAARRLSKYAATDRGLTPGKRYAYQARAVGATGVSTYTAVVYVTADDLRAPGPPRFLTAKDRPEDRGKAVILKWTRSVDDGAGRKIVKSYIIYRRLTSVFDTPTKKVRQLAATGAATYEIVDTTAGLTNLRSYTYWAVAVSNTGVLSAKSKEAQAVPQDNVILAPPTHLTAKDRPSDNGGAILLTWTRSTSEGGIGPPPPPPFGSSAVAEDAPEAVPGVYEISRRRPGQPWPTSPLRTVRASLLGTPAKVTDATGVQNGVTYEYRVRYRVDTALSPFSNVARAAARVGGAASRAAANEATPGLAVRIIEAPAAVAVGASVPVRVVVEGEGVSSVRVLCLLPGSEDWQTAGEMTGTGRYEVGFTLLPGAPAGSEIRLVAVASNATEEAESDEVTVSVSR